MAGAVEAGVAPSTVPGAVPGVRAARLIAAVRTWRPSYVALLLSALAAGLDAVLWGLGPPSVGLVVAGAVFAVAGLTWLLWSAALLHAARTPIRVGDMPLVLIEEGPYRLGRHPMYLGGMVSMLGTALVLASPSMVLATAAFAGMVARVHVPHEEAWLQARFGGWYRDYAGAVRRWL